MANTEYERALERAAAVFNFTVGMTADIFGHGSREHCDAIDRARIEHGRAVESAEHLRAPRVIVVGDHDPEPVRSAA